MNDYIDVAARIVEFREKYPDGSLQPADLAAPYRVETIGDQVFIVAVAAAYRSPEDQRPGIGMAYEQFPGRTPYTKGSELQNAETSAWGRAIVAALAADTKKGIASADEARNRAAEREAPPDPKLLLRNEIAVWVKENGVHMASVQEYFNSLYGHGSRDATEQQLGEFLDILRTQGLQERQETQP